MSKYWLQYPTDNEDCDCVQNFISITFVCKLCITDSDQQNIIHSAIADIHQYTCIRFKWRENEEDYIRIDSNNTGCWSYVGRIGGAQAVNLQKPGCVYYKGTVIHELSHAIGFWHEQTREDRDDWVDINYPNIQKGTYSI